MQVAKEIKELYTLDESLRTTGMGTREDVR